MNTRVHHWLILPFFLVFLNGSFAQSTYQFGLLPSINVNKKLKKDWSLNSKIESRFLINEGAFGGANETNFQYVLTDLSFIAAKKVGLSGKVSGGYLIRFRENEIVNRFIQQYSVVQKMNGFRLAHRLVTDQTFSKITPSEYRLRYRLSAEIPLNGQSADTKELYLKINNEYLNSLQEKEYDLEIRVVPLLGYALNQNHKIEVGLDYRINSFLFSASRQSYWANINWFIEI